MTELDLIHAQAASWITRLQDKSVSLEDTLEWQRWMAQDERHAHAFQRLDEVWSAAGQITPRAHWWDPPRARPRLMLAMAASVVALVAGALLWGAYGTDGFSLFGSHSGSHLTTAVGENRVERLADGSRITLGGNSQVEVDLTERERRIELTRGEAFFSVAKDRTRPFVVRAGDATVTAVGTEFNVRRGGDRVAITVVEGSVMVEPGPGVLPTALLRQFKPKLRPVAVSAGEQTMVAGAGVETATESRDPAAATAWQRGQLAFEREPLRYVLEDVNRYAAKPIVLGDESLGDLQITGTVAGRNLTGWISSLESAFGLDASEEPQQIVLRRR